MATDQTQREKFEQAARELDCDQDEDRWDATLKRVVEHKPAPDQPLEK